MNAYRYNALIYDKVYYNPENGGYVVAHKKHGNAELAQNMIIAKILADRGEGVVLLEDVPNQKSPDARRGNRQWEFKTISKAKNIARAIETALRAAKKQANYVLLYINQKHRIADVRYGVYLAKNNKKLGNIKQIDVLFPSGKKINLKRKEIETGRLAQIFKGS